MCLHDIDDLNGAVAEAARVLAPDGRLCLAIPHPLSTAGSFTSRDGTAPFVVSGSYLEPAPLTMTAEREGMRLTFHSEHRPLEVYMGALEAAGLLTETLREVAPGDDVVALGAQRQIECICAGSAADRMGNLKKSSRFLFKEFYLLPENEILTFENSFHGLQNLYSYLCELRFKIKKRDVCPGLACDSRSQFHVRFVSLDLYS